MVYALMSLGYSPGYHLIQKAVKGMKKLVSSCEGELYAENSTSTVWDTALVSFASQKQAENEKSPYHKVFYILAESAANEESRLGVS